MSEQAITISLYDQLAEALSENVSGESETLTGIRSSAAAAFKQNGFPTTKCEYWRFANLRPYIQDSFHTASAAEVAMPHDLQKTTESGINGLDAYKLVLINGSIDFSLSQLPETDAIQIQPVNSVKNASFFTENINKQLHLEDAGNAFEALNTALFQDGYCIEVKAGAKIDKPIYIYQQFTASENVFLNPRNFILVNKGASLEVIEAADCIGESKYFINSVTDLTIAPHAFLRHTVIQDGNAGERWVNHTQVDQQPNSHYENYIFTFPSADLVRNQLNVELNGQHTETHMYGLYLAGKNQLIDNHTLVGHRLPHCDSNQLYKGVMLDNGKGVFNGRIYVHQDAQKTNAYQSSKNMLLSNDASINAKPQLEIYADDVKCSHGTTIGQFDAEQIFYLQARGISEQQAKAMLVNAFAYDVTQKIPSEALREYVEALVRQTMASATED